MCRCREDVAVARRCGAYDHLGGLTGSGELWSLWRSAPIFVGLVLASKNLVHRRFDDGGLLLRCELNEILLCWKFDVGTESVGVETCFFDQEFVSAGDSFKVYVAAELVDGAQRPGDLDELLHRVVRRLNDPRGKKEALDVVALVEVEREIDDLNWREARTPNVGRDAIDTEDTVVRAEVGEKDLEQGDAAAIRRVAVAYAHAIRVTDAFAIAFALGSGGSAGGVVFGGVCEDLEFLLDIHAAERGSRFSNYEMH